MSEKFVYFAVNNPAAGGARPGRTQEAEAIKIQPMPTRKTLIYIRAMVRRFSNPVFFMLLLMSFILWYVIKLSYTYTTEINIPVKIDSTYYSVRCGVEGVGYQILMHRIAPRKNLVKLSSDNVTITPSAITPGTYEISSFSLQNSISTKISDLKIISVESPVEIEFPKREDD